MGVRTRILIAPQRIDSERLRRRRLPRGPSHLVRVVLFYPWLPAPLAGHGSATLLGALLSELQRKAEIHLVCGRTRHEAPLEASVRAAVASVRIVERPVVPELRGMARLGETAATLVKTSFQGLPLFAAKQWRRSLRQALSEVVRDKRPDVLHLEIGAVAPYAALFPGLPTVLVDHEVLETPVQRTFATRHYARCSAVMALCHHDAEVLADLLGREVVVRPVTLPEREPLARRAVPGRLFFIGSARHAPNHEALRFLVSEVWPVLGRAGLASMPELHVIGARAEEYGLQPGAGLVFRGRVPDLMAAMSEATLVLAPVNEGGGVRIKNCEAVQAGSPLLTTPLGMRGLEEFAPCVNIAPRRQFADALLKLLREPAACEARALEGARHWASARRIEDAAAATCDVWNSLVRTPHAG